MVPDTEFLATIGKIVKDLGDKQAAVAAVNKLLEDAKIKEAGSKGVEQLVTAKKDLDDKLNAVNKLLADEKIKGDGTKGLQEVLSLRNQLAKERDDLDRAMLHGTRWPIGPCALIDLIGVDVHVHASEALWGALREPRFAPPPRLVSMAKAGLLGRKSGRGFYSYG